MNISHARGTLAAVLAAAAFAALTQAGAATAGETDASAARASSATTLFIEDPTGSAFRLVRVEGVGWKYASGWPSNADGSRSFFRKVALGAKSDPQPKADLPSDEPLTVFIDGPSGFTYVWNRDGGWTFVGKLASRQP